MTHRAALNAGDQKQNGYPVQAGKNTAVKLFHQYLSFYKLGFLNVLLNFIFVLIFFCFVFFPSFPPVEKSEDHIWATVVKPQKRREGYLGMMARCVEGAGTTSCSAFPDCNLKSTIC